MFDTLRYKFRNRNSKKNLLKKVKELEDRFSKLRKETLGNNSMGWVTFSAYGTKPKKYTDDSLQGQINDLRTFLDISYTEETLAPNPKEDKN